LQEKEKTNFDLQTEIEWLKNQMKSPHEDRAGLLPDIINIGDADTLDQALTFSSLTRAMENLSKRLECLEKEKKEREKMVIQDMKRDSAEMEHVHNLLKTDSKCKDTVVQVSDDPEEIEATEVNKNSLFSESGSGLRSWCCEWTFVTED
jgi:hypothetical protein